MARKRGGEINLESSRRAKNTSAYHLGRQTCFLQSVCGIKSGVHIVGFVFFFFRKAHTSQNRRSPTRQTLLPNHKHRRTRFQILKTYPPPKNKLAPPTTRSNILFSARIARCLISASRRRRRFSSSADRCLGEGRNSKPFGNKNVKQRREA